MPITPRATAITHSSLAIRSARPFLTNMKPPDINIAVQPVCAMMNLLIEALLSSENVIDKTSSKVNAKYRLRTHGTELRTAISVALKGRETEMHANSKIACG